MPANADSVKIEKLFKQSNITGSLLIESGSSKAKYAYNIDNTERFVPASTFKILNTLIFLEEGLVKDEHESIPWDGVERSYSPWNQDQTLTSAFQYSCVWCYQRYAAKVGDSTYREYLKTFNYGNKLTGKDITRFWLEGDLRISAGEQIDFLRKVYSGDLPVQKKHLNTLKTIMLLDESDSYQIWSKTGWSGKDGWYVGYLKKADGVWFFANHIEINRKEDLAFRKSLVMESFKALNIIQ
ncbi:MAG: class D beta-lactamase [Cellvibrionaceae bacterium]